MCVFVFEQIESLCIGLRNKKGNGYLKGSKRLFYVFVLFMLLVVIILKFLYIYFFQIIKGKENNVFVFSKLCCLLVIRCIDGIY